MKTGWVVCPVCKNRLEIYISDSEIVLKEIKED